MRLTQHENSGPDLQMFALIHWLGVEVVQQVVRVAVAVSAHHHQGNEGGQENGGQHPNGHNHHCLHGDSGSHGGCRQQLVFQRKESNQGRLIVRARLWTGAHLSRGEWRFQSDWVKSVWRRVTLTPHLRTFLQEISHISIFVGTQRTSGQRRIQSAAFCLFLNVAHPQRTHKLIFIWVHKELQCTLFALHTL